MRNTFLSALVILLSSSAITVNAQVKFDFDMGQRGPSIGEDQYGIFYEEINHAGDGGLYAELIRNRSFEEDRNSPVFWNVVGSGTIKLDTQHLLNIYQEHSVRFVSNSTTSGIRNDGYWGMNIVKGDTYQLSFWVMTMSDWMGRFIAELQSPDGANCGRALMDVELTAGEWKNITAEILATKSAQSGKFMLRPNKKGTYYFDVISLFPPTFKDRKNGLRKDLGQMLYDLKPGFVRFPGGCYIEGLWANGKDNRFEWKKTIGPIEERPGHRNQNWGYQITDGQGYHEYLEMCEDFGADAMFVVNMGWGHDWQVSINDIGPYIQEALDAVEYAMGDTTTTYGRMRKRNGHPEPFKLKYLEIGNENEWFDHYPDRYAEFYKAIKSKWPELHLIANGNWNNAFPAELQDEHYYMSPEWFVSQYNKYDSYPRSKAKVYVGEYAVTQNPGRYGNLNAAIGEAVFMQGMENNSDVCVMGSYAPIFANENAVAWHPDMIRFNANMSYGTPSYYVQKLFANNVGKQNIKWTETDNIPPVDESVSSFGVGTWATAATFSDVSVKTDEVEIIGTATTNADWTVHGGTWTADDGVFKQTNTSAAPAYYTYNTPFNNENMTFSLKATKDGGSEGFLILIDYKDENNYTWWNIGGWGNTKHAIERCTAGAKQTVTDKSGSLETGHEYTITIKKTDTKCQCYLDGELIHEFTMGGHSDRAVYASASINDDEGKLYVKLVNPNPNPSTATLTFKNGKVNAISAEVLTSTYGTDENSTSSPKKVVPRNRIVDLNEDGTVTYVVPAFSVNVLVADVSDVTLSQEIATLPEPKVRYGFESGEPQDDSGKYVGTLEGSSSIISTENGNHLLYTGEIGGKGYMDMGVRMPHEVLNSLNDYSVSINILLGVNNTTGSFAWGYALANSTSQYIGLVNAGGNGNWYYEIKNGSAQSVRSNSGLNPTLWHNITYTQSGNVGRIYVDGQLRNTSNVSICPKDIASSVQSAWLARSPFSGDAYLENAFIDDFCIFDECLTPEQVLAITETAAKREVPTETYVGMSEAQDLNNLVKLVKNYVNESGDENLQTAFSTAQRAVSSTSSSLMHRAYETLKAAVDDYTSEQMALAKSGNPANLTFLLLNSSFTMGPTFWIGADTPFSPVSGSANGVLAGYTNETAEQFSRSFDICQEICGLPAGEYSLTASAFYRAGAVADAYNAYNENSDVIKNAELYMNDNAVPLANLFSETEAFTYDPYTYPDNITAAGNAFNKSALYANNNVTTVLSEGQILKCGIRKLTTIANDWAAYDNLQLFYLGQADDIQQVVDHGEPSAQVRRIEYYSPGGIRLRAPEKGVNIIRIYYSDNSTKTVKIIK